MSHWPFRLTGIKPLQILHALTYLIPKGALSGILIAPASEVARRQAGLGAMNASLPLVSLMWLWRDMQDPIRLADHAQATPWFVAPSLPMFVLNPVLLRRGMGFWPALALGCTLTIALYAGVVLLARKLGMTL